VGAVRRPRLRFGPFRVWSELGEAETASAAAAERGTEEPLSVTDEERVEAEVRRMIGELRAKPSQEKEDRVGVEIAAMPPAERDLVPGILLRIVAEESGRGADPADR
jgi:hypothetical protein